MPPTASLSPPAPAEESAAQALLSAEERAAVFADCLERTPHVLGLFRFPDFQAVYLNPAGQRCLVQQGNAAAVPLSLLSIVGISNADRFQREVLPQIHVLGAWSGQLCLRDAFGTEIRSIVSLLASRESPPNGSRVLCLHAVFGTAPSRTGAEPILSDEDMLHALLETVPDSIYFKDKASRFLRLSRAQSLKFGLGDPRDAIGKTDFDFFAIEHATSAFQAEQEILKSGAPLVDFEEKEMFDNGRVGWVSTTKMPLRNRDGLVIGTFGISHDITARKRTEEALREGESRFRSIFEGANDAILLLSGDQLVDCNHRAVEMFERGKEELTHLRPDQISPALQPDGRESPVAAKAFLAQALAQGWCRFEWAHCRKSGQEFPADVLLSAFLNGGKQMVQATVRDITERKQVETQRREYETRLLLAQKLESVGRLAAGVAHEINTPTQYVSDNARFLLSAFSQLTQILASHRVLIDAVAAGSSHAAAITAVRESETENELDYLLAEIPRTLEQSLDGLNRIGRIVSSLKEFSHPGGTEKSAADLNRSIETAVAVSRHEWKYVAEAATELDPELPAVPCVLDEFNQTILNLITNAAHAVGAANTVTGRKMGRIVIRSRREGDWAVIEVEDNGIGIPPEIQSRIFEPFFTTKGIGEGTGQGLSIVRNVIVKGHGGKVDFLTTPGQGTTFRISLPIKHVVEPTTAALPAPTPAPAASS